LGDLMIKHRIHWMRHFQGIRRGVLEPAALRLYLFEVDWCQFVGLGPRILCFLAMLLLNAYMIAAFLKGMQLSGSVVGTAIATAANFVLSALYGYILWDERFAPAWWLGFGSVMAGVLLLSTTSSTTTTTKTTRSHVSKSNHSKASSKLRPPTFRPPALTIPSPKKSASALRQYGSPSASSSLSSSFSVVSSSSNNNNNNNNNHKKKVKPGPGLYKTQEELTTALVDRTFANECPLCEGQLFDESTGESKMAIADLSPNCFHVLHAKCLKQQTTPGKTSTCPVCDTSISMWISAKQAAHFAGFWMDRVESCLQQVGPLYLNNDNNENTTKDGLPQPQPASVVRQFLQQDATLSDLQKRYIEGDPTGLGKGLASSLEWGGSVDYNEQKKGHVGWSQCLRTQGVWHYNVKRDELWLWEWDSVHPRQRCDQCQFVKRPLPISCKGCEGSSEAAYYCSEPCQKRDWQRHKMTCQLWQSQGPKK
jgi:multidrug transporter EmrE-like cation transporter